MHDDARFDPQGIGWNELPHLLTAVLDADWAQGVRWSVQCSYEGAGRPCGLLEKCTEHDRPEEPSGMTSVEALDDPEFRRLWTEWQAAEERWEEDHPDGEYHAGDHCWVKYMIDSGDCEADYYLIDMPKGRVIDGPLRVLVGRTGYLDEREPVFRLWDDNNKDGESR